MAYIKPCPDPILKYSNVFPYVANSYCVQLYYMSAVNSISLDLLIMSHILGSKHIKKMCLPHFY
jgi:hypothetical protein